MSEASGLTTITDALRRAPAIAAVRGREQLQRALRARAAVVFLLEGDPFTLPDMVREAREAGKPAFVHMELVDGISRDAAGVRWIARTVKPAGVLSTRAALVKAAADEGLRTVLRIFLVDSSSLESGVRMVKSCAPDYCEVMPGLVTRAIGQLGRRIVPPLIAGGMLERAEDVRAALAAGALAVSTSSEPLWSQEGW